MSGLLDFLQGASNAAASNVSAPVDGLAWLLRKAGVPVGDAPVGGSDWMRAKGLTADAPGIGGLLGESVGGVAPMLAAAKAPQIAGGLLQAGENMAQRATMNPQAGAIVWHGSPHKFDAFDSSKIGAGEGAQAYGHGLYLAESPDVAGFYRNAGQGSSLSQKIATDKARDMFRQHFGADKKSFGPLTDKTVDDIANLMDGGFSTFIRDKLPEKLVLELEKSTTKGSLYKVDLPDEKIAKMLDWDKPLSHQHPDVQAAATNLGIANAANGEDLLWKIKRTKYDAKDAMRGNTGLNDAGSFASERLKSQGIPGIRYLDGGSRGTGTGTSNFVIFPGNEGLLSILERNGVPLK